jgi:hypothetical protein
MLLKKGRSKISSVLVFTLLFSLLLPAFAFGAAATPVQLKDIADSYAQKEIQSLVDNGIISGYEDGSFQPRKTITRAELAKIIVLSLGLKENPDQAAAFTDVDKNSWYRGFVGALVESKITQGNSATTFAPEAKVTREELAVFFVRALGLEETAGKVVVDAQVSDLAQVSSWAQAHVSLAFKVGFLQGIENADKTLKFSPKDNSERQAVARLAYEFKNNKDTFVNKAKELVNGNLKVSSATVTNNTTVEVTFSSAVTTVAAADFTFDNSLTVTKAELKSGSTTVVVLTTSVQTPGTVYKLSYLGKDTGITITGAYSGGSGSSSSSSSSSNNTANFKSLLASGGVLNQSITLTASDTYGPADGATTIINGTLILDPGAAGEITLQNIKADNIVVVSGSENSIKLRNIIVIVLLKIDTGAQANAVRVESSGTTVIASTYVGSQVIIEVKSGRFGNINIGAGAAGKNIELRGSITDAVYVNASANINIGNSTVSGTVNNLNLNVSATITTASNSKVDKLQVTAPNVKVSLKGPGAVASVTATSFAIGLVIDLSEDSNVTTVYYLSVSVKFSGSANKIRVVVIIIVVVGAKATAEDPTVVPGSSSGNNGGNTGGNNGGNTGGNNGGNTGGNNGGNTGGNNGGTTPTVPASVTNLTYADLTSSGAKLTWSAASNATGYNIYQGSSSTASATVTTAFYTITGLSLGTAYDYTVKAYNSTGESTGASVSFKTNSVTSVTYVTYNKTSSVTGSVYSGNAGANTAADTSAFHIANANAADYLIVGFSTSLSTDLTGVTVTSAPTVTASAYAVETTVSNNTYLAIKYSASRAAGPYVIKITGLKQAGNILDSVTFNVYQD